MIDTVELTAYRWRFLPSGFNETACQTLLTVILEADTHTNRLANAARGFCRSVLPEGRATLRRRCPCFPFASQPLEAKSVGLLIVCPLPKEGWLLTSLLSGLFREPTAPPAARGRAARTASPTVKQAIMEPGPAGLQPTPGMTTPGRRTPIEQSHHPVVSSVTETETFQNGSGMALAFWAANQGKG
jgi:hypothetical protein